MLQTFDVTAQLAVGLLQVSVDGEQELVGRGRGTGLAVLVGAQDGLELEFLLNWVVQRVFTELEFVRNVFEWPERRSLAARLKTPPTLLLTLLSVLFLLPVPFLVPLLFPLLTLLLEHRELQQRRVQFLP